MKYNLHKSLLLLGIIIPSFLFSACSEKSEYFHISSKTKVWLGVSTDKLTEQLRAFFKVPEYLGVLVKEVVEDSPAEKYGLKAGDVITQVGKKEIEDPHDLMRAIDRYEPGEEVDVKIIRDKKEQIVKVKLGERKGRFRHYFSFKPEKFKFYAPEIEIEIPEMDITIPEIDTEELEELHEKIREELEMHTDELNEELEKLNEKLKEIKIRARYRKSIVI